MARILQVLASWAVHHGPGLDRTTGRPDPGMLPEPFCRATILLDHHSDSGRAASRPGPGRLRPGSTLDHDVVAGPAVEDVLPRPADQDVVAGAAEQHVVARAADQDVVAVAAVGRELDRAGGQARGRPPRRRRPGR